MDNLPNKPIGNIPKDTGNLSGPISQSTQNIRAIVFCRSMNHILEHQQFID